MALVRRNVVAEAGDPDRFVAQRDAAGWLETGARR